MSDWITDNRGEGPWDFEAQKDKLGYVNNPRFTTAPASLIEHEPCGYWFKGTTPSPLLMNLYVVSRNGGFWALYFNGVTLSYVNKYVDFNNNLWMVNVDGQNVVLCDYSGPAQSIPFNRISLTVPFTLQNSIFPFSANDLPVGLTAAIALRCLPGGNKLFFFTAHSVGHVVRTSTSYQREARGYNCTVVTGTDGKLYVSDDQFAVHSWDATYRPISGAFWAFRWVLLPDMVCDSPIATWGVGPLHQGMTGSRSQIIDGYLFAVAGTPFGLRKIDLTTLGILAGNPNVPEVSFAPEGHAGKIYTIHSSKVSSSTCEYTVRSWSAMDCSAILVGTPYTAPIGSQGPCGILACSSYLLAWMYIGGAGLAHEWRLAKIDYDTLAVIQSATLIVPEPSGVNIINIFAYDDKQWVAIYYRGVGIINAGSLTWKQNVDLIAQGMDTNFNVDSTFLYSAPSVPITTQGDINPIWTMPTA